MIDPDRLLAVFTARRVCTPRYLAFVLEAGTNAVLAGCRELIREGRLVPVYAHPNDYLHEAMPLTVTELPR